MKAATAILVAALAGASGAGASGMIVAGRGVARILPPAGAVIETYSNAGYELGFVDGAVEVKVDNGPIGSSAPLRLPEAGANDAVAQLGRRLAAGAPTLVEGAGRVLSWVAGHIRYELDRGQSQEPAVGARAAFRFLHRHRASDGGAPRRSWHRGA